MRVVLAHGHIFKNAGSTFDWSLGRNFGECFVDHREDDLMRKGGAQYLEECLVGNPGIRAISSHHMCYPFPEIDDIKIIPTYFIRHPIDRIRSVYNFERRQKASTPGAKAAKEYSFQEYVEWRMKPDVGRTIRDYQATYLSGRFRRRNHLPVTVGLLMKAIQNIRHTYCVGVVDRYDESMVCFENELKQYFPEIDLSYIRQNATDNNSMGLDEAVSDALETLGTLARQMLGNNAADLFLYRMANELLDEKIEGIVGFDERLLEFRERCQSLAC
ncbi:MAG: hypothetical protein OEU44_02745 [Gammaproteobacteria bacterium]|nr:hypothetical protein [Gammaproteobacteria bacterium]